MSCPQSDPPRPLILVVSGERSLHTVLRGFLEGEGFLIMAAEDGASALALLQRQAVDMVLLDLHLSGMSGRELCLTINRQMAEPPPLLVMIERYQDVEAHQLHEAGVADYVRKPPHLPVLLQRIRTLLRAQQTCRALGLLTQKYEMILDTVDSGICGVDCHGLIAYMNQAGRHLLGYTTDELLGRHCQEIFHIALAGSESFEENCFPFLDSDQEDAPAHFNEARMERRDGSTFLAELRSAPLILDGRLTGGVAVFQDITERQKAEQLIRHMANHDALTNLPNRNHLLARLPQAICLARRQERPLFLLFIDLDRFKPVNDLHGHAVGDEVLIQVGKRLKSAVRTADSVCRLGGDEFVILLESASSLHGAIMVAERAIELLNQPVDVHGLCCSIGASIGIAAYPDNAATADELLRHADQAMYEAKKRGRNCWRLYGDQGGGRNAARPFRPAAPLPE